MIRTSLILILLAISTPSLAFTPKQQIFDTVTQWYYVVSHIKNGDIYITTNEEGFRPIPRKAEQLVAGVENDGKFKLGQTVAYYHDRFQFMQSGKIIALFPNGYAFLYAKSFNSAFTPTKTVRIGTSLLAAETESFEGIKAGDALCAKEPFQAEKGNVRKGTKLRVKKVFSNGSAEVRVGWLLYPEMVDVRNMVPCQ